MQLKNNALPVKLVVFKHSKLQTNNNFLDNQICHRTAFKMPTRPKRNSDISVLCTSMPSRSIRSICLLQPYVLKNKSVHNQYRHHWHPLPNFFERITAKCENSTTKYLRWTAHSKCILLSLTETDNTRFDLSPMDKHNIRMWVWERKMTVVPNTTIMCALCC